MTASIRTEYDQALHLATMAVAIGDRAGAMSFLKSAMACANKVSNDPRYRKAVFKAMSFARRIGA